MSDDKTTVSREIILADDAIMVSNTNTKARLIFVDRALLKYSGYSAEELLGKSHYKMFPQPETPQMVLDDRAQTIAAGKPWEGLVKNYTKSGDYYWTHANLSPIEENGQVTSMITVRSKPARERVKYIEALYADLNAGKRQHIKIKEGLFYDTSLRGRIGALFLSLRGRLISAFAILLLTTLAVGATGLAGILSADNAVHSAYADRAVVIISTLMALTVLLAIFLSLFLLRSINQPIRQLQAHFEAIARSDFSREIEMAAIAEFKPITGYLRGLRAKLAYARIEKIESDVAAREVRQRELDQVADVIKDRIKTMAAEHHPDHALVLKRKVLAG